MSRPKCNHCGHVTREVQLFTEFGEAKHEDILYCHVWRRIVDPDDVCPEWIDWDAMSEPRSHVKDRRA